MKGKGIMLRHGIGLTGGSMSLHSLCAAGGDQVHLIHAEREAVDMDEPVCVCVHVNKYLCMIKDDMQPPLDHDHMSSADTAKAGIRGLGTCVHIRREASSMSVC